MNNGSKLAKDGSDPGANATQNVPARLRFFFLRFNESLDAEALPRQASAKDNQKVHRVLSPLMIQVQNGSPRCEKRSLSLTFPYENDDHLSRQARDRKSEGTKDRFRRSSWSSCRTQQSSTKSPILNFSSM